MTHVAYGDSLKLKNSLDCLIEDKRKNSLECRIENKETLGMTY
jgi:hypothetical protein